MQNNDHVTFLLKLRMLEDDYGETTEMHHDALIKDIENIEGVSSALSATNGKIIKIEIQTNLEEKEFKDVLRVYLIREIDFFRFLSLEISNI